MYFVDISSEIDQLTMRLINSRHARHNRNQERYGSNVGFFLLMHVYVSIYRLEEYERV